MSSIPLSQIPRVVVTVTARRGESLLGRVERRRYTFDRWTAAMVGEIFVAEEGGGDSLTFMWYPTHEENLGTVGEWTVHGLQLSPAQRDSLLTNRGSGIIGRLVGLSLPE